jgi:hypothetical protein
MPRQRRLLDQIGSIGQQLVRELESRIAELEEQLDHARDQLSNWLTVLRGKAGAAVRRRGRVGRPPGSGAGKRAKAKVGRPRAAKGRKAGRPKRSSPPVQWENVLGKLSSQFSMEDLVKATPQLNAHPQARFIALARWTRGKQIKKTGPGKYRKS